MNKRKRGDPLIYVPDNARLNFETTPEKMPTTEYNRYVYIMDEKTYKSVTGKTNDGRPQENRPT